MFKKLFTLITLTAVLASCSSKKEMNKEKENVEAKAEEVKADMKKGAKEVKQDVAMEAESRTTEMKKDMPKAAGNMDKDYMESSTTTCTLNNDTRVITVAKVSETACDVNYTKFSEDTQIANAQNDPSFCVSVKDKVVGNLEAAGFSCAQ